jgi:hypothetical protein
MWESSGALFIFLAGAALHFVYELSGAWPPVALIAAVNESVWEHLKIAFWPALAFAAFEHAHVKQHARNFWMAKAAGFLVNPAFIVVFFYTYTALLGTHVLWIDIGSFLLAAIAGQLTSFRLMTAPELPKRLRQAGIIVVAALAAAFSLLSYHPPEVFLFRDGPTRKYGLEAFKPHFGKQSEHHEHDH